MAVNVEISSWTGFEIGKIIIHYMKKKNSKPHLLTTMHIFRNNFEGLLALWRHKFSLIVLDFLFDTWGDETQRIEPSYSTTHGKVGAQVHGPRVLQAPWLDVFCNQIPPSYLSLWQVRGAGYLKVKSSTAARSDEFLLENLFLIFFCQIWSLISEFCALAVLQGGSGCRRRDNCAFEQPLGPHLLHWFLGSVRLDDGGYGWGGGSGNCAVQPEQNSECMV